MKTAQAVGDGSERARQRAKLPDELLGRFHRRVADLHRRIEEGTIDFDVAMTGLQGVIEGRFPLTPASRTWREEDGVIYFSVTSDGTTGAQWIELLEKRGDQVSEWAKRALLSQEFKPTNGVTAEIVVLKGSLFEDGNRITSNIRAEAERRELDKPNAETACLIRRMFTDKDLGVMCLSGIIVMHEPIDDSSGPGLLGLCRNNDGRLLSAHDGYPSNVWRREDGFAFSRRK